MPALSLIIVCLLIICALVGVFGLVWPRRGLSILAAVLVVIVLGLVAGEWAVRGLRLGPLVAFALLGASLLSLHADWFRSVLHRMAAAPRSFPRLVFGATFACSAVCLVDMRSTESPLEVAESPANLLEPQELVRLIPVAHDARTDADRSVRLFVYGEIVPTSLTEADQKFISMMPGGLLFVGYQGACNCHGFVFAGGRYWIMNASVAAILKDNGYRRVSEPAVGDLIVYWDETGSPIHTGIVRAVPRHGPIRIESKWGMRGQFIHTPQAQVFSQTYSYFHSSRHGHRLRGLDEADDMTD